MQIDHGSPSQFIPIDYKNQITCMRKWSRSRELGKGSYGTVSEACFMGNCSFVMKISNISTPDLLYMYENEVDITRRLSGTGICPEYKDSWICEDFGYLVSEKWDGSVDKVLNVYIYILIHSQLFIKQPIDNGKFRWILPDWAFEGMVKILIKLSQKRIIHGDVKVSILIFLIIFKARQLSL